MSIKIVVHVASGQEVTEKMSELISEIRKVCKQKSVEIDYIEISGKSD
jgi:hypothetical protein